MVVKETEIQQCHLTVQVQKVEPAAAAVVVAPLEVQVVELAVVVAVVARDGHLEEVVAVVAALRRRRQEAVAAETSRIMDRYRPRRHISRRHKNQKRWSPPEVILLMRGEDGRR